MASPLTAGQRQFAARLVARTGLDRRLVGGWLLSEESSGYARAREAAGNHNWLNVGYTDSGERGTGNAVWRDPVRAADATARWLEGRYSVPGFGRAAPGIVAFARTAGKPLDVQLRALQQSGWASSAYPSLPSLVKQWSGRFGIGTGGSASSLPAAASARTRTSTVVDEGAFAQAARRFALGQLLAQAPRSPFDIGPRASIETPNTLLAVLPTTAPVAGDFARTVTTLAPKRAAPALVVARAPRGGAYAGTEAIVKQLIDPVAAKSGIHASNYKRTPQQNAAVGGSPTSDHLTTNRRAFAADYPTTDGEALAQRMARAVGIRGYRTGTFDHYTVRVGGRQFRVQILWGVEGHGDHVHFGLEAID